MFISRRRLIQALACTAFSANLPSRFAWAQKLTAGESLPAVGDSPDDAGPLANDLSAKLDSAAIARAMQKVGTWELNRTRGVFNDDWTFAALYTGFMAAGRSLHDPKYEEAMLEMGRKLQWQLGPDETHADHQAVGQTYLELYLKYRDEAMLQPTRTRFDRTMQLPDNPDKPLWWWCDALFMAPPVYARLYAAIAEPVYLDYMNREWWITSQLLYDTTDNLYFRDTRYFEKRESNGRKVFWSRGNGWVLAGLARVLQYIPESYPTRQKYILQFRQMADKLRQLQGQDGLWRPGLLDPEAYSLSPKYRAPDSSPTGWHGESTRAFSTASSSTRQSPKRGKAWCRTSIGMAVSAASSPSPRRPASSNLPPVTFMEWAHSYSLAPS